MIYDRNPFSFSSLNRVILENINFDALEVTKISSSFMDMQFLDSFYGSGITIKNSNLNKIISFISLSSDTTKKTVLKNVVLLNVTLDDASILLVKKVTNLVIENVIAKNLNRVESSENSYALFNFQRLASIKESNFTIQNITISESDMEILNVKSSSNKENTNQYLRMANVHIKN